MGAYYLIRGTNSFGEPIPPQLLRPEALPYTSVGPYASWYVSATTWMTIPGTPGIWKGHQHNYPLESLNITQEAITNDFYIERIDIDDWASARRRGYYDLLCGVHRPKVYRP